MLRRKTRRESTVKKEGMWMGKKGRGREVGDVGKNGKRHLYVVSSFEILHGGWKYKRACEGVVYK